MRVWSLVLAGWLGVGSTFAADVFDRHTAKELQQALDKGPSVPQLTLNDAAKLRPLGASVSSPCVVVKTDDANYAKALVGWGLRKGGEKPTPVLMIERYVTYRGDRPDLTSAVGKDVMLFPGFGFNFDIGQVVPAGQGADVEFTTESALRAVDGATLVPLNGSLLPPPDKSARHDPLASEQVTPADLVGTWKINADGRWLGEWDLDVKEGGRITGTYVSEESQNRYDITGQFGSAPHNVKLEIFLANTQLQIDGYLWTKDKSMIAGTVTMTGRKFGFVATREK